jgi:steroid delta-isomerase-like uncharacterized protein
MSNRSTFESAIACFADPTRREEYFHLYTDDIVLHGYQGVEPGLESVRRFYHAFWKVFPDAAVTIQEIIEDGDRLVARYLITGTQQETLMGVPARGQKMELPGISGLHFKDGHCFERWACSDSLIVFHQIGGSLPSP